MENNTKGVIFHVEDDPSWQEIVPELVRREGHEVVLQVGTVAQALAAIPDQLIALGVNVAITDGELPDGKGEQVAQAIRDSKLPIGIVGLSGRTVQKVDVSVSKGDPFEIRHAITSVLA